MNELSNDKEQSIDPYTKAYDDGFNKGVHIGFKAGLEAAKQSIIQITEREEQARY